MLRKRAPDFAMLMPLRRHARCRARCAHVRECDHEKVPRLPSPSFDENAR